MGLGKTLTMVALVASDLDNIEAEHADDTCERIGDKFLPKIPGTLVIVPPPRRLNGRPVVLHLCVWIC